MGSGFAQVGVLLALTVIGLPLFFFGLMAALDRFEQSLERAPRKVTATTQAADVAPLPVAPSPGSPAPVTSKPVASKSTSAATI